MKELIIVESNKFENVERKFLEVMAWVERNDFSEARKILLDIISENPGFPNSYGYLGWLYATKFSNDKQAEIYYKKGIEVANEDYFINHYMYISFLIERLRTKEAEILLKKIENKNSVSLFEIYQSYGILYEVEGQLNKAIKYFSFALQKSLNSDAFNRMTENIARCKKKKYALSPIFSNFSDQSRRSILVLVISFIFLIFLMLISKFQVL